MRRFILRSIVLTACSFLVADTIAAYLEQTLVPPALMTSPPTGSSNAPHASMDLASLSQEIAQSELFPPLPAGVASAGGYGRTLPPPPLDAAKKIKLMGTVMGEGLSALAVVQTLANEHQALYHVHEQIPGIGEISEVRADAILLRSGAQEELLELAGLKFATTHLAAILSTPPPEANPEDEDAPHQQNAASAPPVRSKATGYQRRVLLDRRAFASDAESLTHERQVRFQPVATEGKAEGLRLQFFQAGGLVDQLGLSFGDVIQGVNGIRVNDVNVLLKQFRMLKEERSFSVDVVRNGEKRTLSYEIR